MSKNILSNITEHHLNISVNTIEELNLLKSGLQISVKNIHSSNCLFIKISSDKKEILNSALWLYNEMNYRINLLIKEKKRSIYDYGNVFGDELRYIYVTFDLDHNRSIILDDEAIELLTRIIQKSRHVGIHFWNIHIETDDYQPTFLDNIMNNMLIDKMTTNEMMVDYFTKIEHVEDTKIYESIHSKEDLLYDIVSYLFDHKYINMTTLMDKFDLDKKTADEIMNELFDMGFIKE